MSRERGLTNIQMNPEIHLHHIGANKFSSQMKNSVRRLFEMNALYVNFYDQRCHSFHRYIQNIFTVYYFLASFSISQFQLSTNSGRNALSISNLPKQTCIHSHLICQNSMKANPQHKECVCVGWGEGRGRTG